LAIGPTVVDPSTTMLFASPARHVPTTPKPAIITAAICFNPFICHSPLSLVFSVSFYPVSIIPRMPLIAAGGEEIPVGPVVARRPHTVQFTFADHVFKLRAGRPFIHLHAAAKFADRQPMAARQRAPDPGADLSALPAGRYFVNHTCIHSSPHPF
jgi:hypothetical protein